jgi:hypothetical protein
VFSGLGLDIVLGFVKIDVGVFEVIFGVEFGPILILEYDP